MVRFGGKDLVLSLQTKGLPSGGPNPRKQVSKPNLNPSCFSLCSVTSPAGTLHTPLHKVNGCYMTLSSTEVSLKKADQSITRQFRLGDLPSTAILFLLSLISEHKQFLVWPRWYLVPRSTATKCHTNTLCTACAKPELDYTQAFLTAGDFLLYHMPLLPRDLLTTTLGHAVRVDLHFPEPCPLSDITWWVSSHAQSSGTAKGC